MKNKNIKKTIKNKGINKIEKNKKHSRIKFIFIIPLIAFLLFTFSTGWVPFTNYHFLEGNLFFDQVRTENIKYTTPNVVLLEQEWDMKKEGAPDKNDILLKFGMSNEKNMPIYMQDIEIGYKGYGLRGRNFKIYELSDKHEKFIADLKCTEGCSENGETIMNDKERSTKARFKFTDEKGVKIFDEKGIKSFIIKGEVAIFNEVNNGGNKARGMVWIEKEKVKLSNSKRGEPIFAKGWINSFNNANKYVIYSEIKKFE
jgi:hypothetical protein